MMSANNQSDGVPPLHQRLINAFMHLTRPVRVRINYGLAFLWRRLLFRTRFVAVTGSAGKTLTKDLITRALRTRYRVIATEGTFNNSSGFLSVLLRARPWHDFVVVETPVGGRFRMAQLSRLLRPDVAVMLNAGEFHTDVFGSVAGVAREKAHLFDHVAADGCAVINLDCPHTRSAVTIRSARRLGYGRDADADLRLTRVESRWPERLTIAGELQGEQFQIRSRMVGTHWAGSLAAALGAAVACGIPLSAAVAAIEAAEPNWGRMQPIYLPDRDATVIRDERNGSRDTYRVAFDVLRAAEAGRRIAVIGSYSEFEDQDLETRAAWLAEHAARSADLVIFVGEIASAGVAAAAARGLSPEFVTGFGNATEAGRHLQAIIRPGDLVLLKGRRRDHMSRAYLQLLGEVECVWAQCSLEHICDKCKWLGFRLQPELEGYMCPQDQYF